MSAGLLNLDEIPYGASALSIGTHRLSQLVRRELERTLSHHGKLSLIDWRICLGLSRSEATTQKELVKFTRMQQAQVSRSLLTLEKRGLIRSVRSEEDRRARLFSLTEKGQKQFKHNLPVVVAFCEAVDNALSAEEIKQYLEMSERIARAAREAGGILTGKIENVA